MKTVALVFALLFGSFANANLKSSDPLPQNLFVELAKMINPAVISVNIATPQRMGGNAGMYRDPFWDLLEQFMGQQRVLPKEKEFRPVGTGFIIESEGLAITNNHVIEIADEIKVQLHDTGKTYPAEVIGRDARTDIALLKIKADTKLPTVKLGSSKDSQVGEWVAAFGNPYGHTFSMSKGILSAIGRQIKELNSIPFLQTDAAINPGNSGGPLVNTKGEVIGVNTAIDARAQGIGFAIPIDYVKDLLPQLKSKGRVVRGYIGVAIDEIGPRAQQALDLPDDKGALIMDVEPGGPADRAGIEAYDVVRKFGEKEVTDVQDLMDAVASTPINSTAKVELIRAGKKKTVSVKISEPPEAKPARAQKQDRSRGGTSSTKELGFVVQDYSADIAKRFGISEGSPKRPVVVDVEPDSPAAMARLRPGDMILDINRQAVRNASDVAKLLRPGSNMIRVQNGRTINLVFLNIR